MRNTLSEDQIERHLLDNFICPLGYDYVFGPELLPDGKQPERTPGEVVLKNRLRRSIARLNPQLPADACELVFRKIQRTANPDILLNNMAAHRWLTEGVEVEYRTKSGEIRTELTQLIDFENPDNNEWLAVNQFTVIENHKNRRPDVVIFVNGLPLVLFEIKNAVAEKATIQAAFNQIQTYKKDIPSLFQWNALCILTDGWSARAGTMAAALNRFQVWKSADGQQIIDEKSRETELLVKGMLDHRRLLDLLRHFIVFEEEKSGLVKKVAAYHQYFAVNKALACVQTASKTGGDGRGGVVWHTQGSGKSLSMVFLTSKLAVNAAMQNPTVVVLTDRNDLDQQLFETFANCRQLLRQTPKQAESRSHLKTLLQVASGGVVFTTIQKFVETELVRLPDGSEKRVIAPFPELSPRRNVVVIADEAHRSQYDFIDGFAHNLRRALPNATFLGFTGTPIEKVDADTRRVFGDYIDIYDIQRAERDGATVKIFYESRLAKIRLDEAEQRELDARVDAVMDEYLTENEELTQRQQQTAKWTRVEAVVGAKKRLAKVAADIVEHFEKRDHAALSKAMIVCMSRRIAVEVYEEIRKIRPGWHDEDDAKGQIKVVITGSASDDAALQTHVRNKNSNDGIARRLKDPKNDLKIVIVRDMWLTGFDAPVLNTLYVDKPMSGHNLMQAIARVNRVFMEKQGGLIVDYIGIAHNLKLALDNYIANEGKGELAYDFEDAANALKLYFEKVQGLFAKTGNQQGFKYLFYHQLTTTAQRLEYIADMADYIFGLDNGKGKEIFGQHVGNLMKAYALAGAHQYATEIHDDVALFQAVRSFIQKTTDENIEKRQREKGAKTIEEVETAIRELVNESILTDDVVDLFAAAGLKTPDITSILSEDFLKEIKGMQRKNLALEMLKKLLAEEIKIYGQTNIVQSKKFSEMLAQAVLRYQNNILTSAEVLEELMQMARDFKKAKNKGAELGLTEKETAFYDALAENESAREILNDAVLTKIAIELFENIRKNASIDWSVKESARAKLRVMIKRILRQYNYPPDLQEKAIELVLQQAEWLVPGEVES